MVEAAAVVLDVLDERLVGRALLRGGAELAHDRAADRGRLVQLQPSLEHREQDVEIEGVREEVWESACVLARMIAAVSGRRLTGIDGRRSRRVCRGDVHRAAGEGVGDAADHGRVVHLGRGRDP